MNILHSLKCETSDKLYALLSYLESMGYHFATTNYPTSEYNHIARRLPVYISFEEGPKQAYYDDATLFEGYYIKTKPSRRIAVYDIDNFIVDKLKQEKIE